VLFHHYFAEDLLLLSFQPHWVCLCRPNWVCQLCLCSLVLLERRSSLVFVPLLWCMHADFLLFYGVASPVYKVRDSCSVCTVVTRGRSNATWSSRRVECAGVWRDNSRLINRYLSAQ
jgi:hypothetical protein